MKRILWLCVFLCFACFITPLWPESPSILLITIDTVRADALSCYGSRNKTPNLDAIARGGVLYENAFATVPLTFPSHVSIFTGLYPARHGIHHNGTQRFRDSSFTLPHLLRNKGYRTAAVVSSYVLDRKFGLADSFDFYDDTFERSAGSLEAVHAERTADKAYSALMELMPKLRGGRWFAWIHFFDPHIPYSPPAPHQGYGGEVEFVDLQVGKLLQWLKQNQLDENLILAVVGDHGESLGAHGEDTHGFFVYNSTLRVPFLLSYPGCKPSRIKAPVSIVDLAPTLLQLAGVSDPVKRDGLNLVGTIGTRSIYFESLYPQLHGWNWLKGIARNEWKFIYTTRPELYNIALDPAEKNNIYSKETKTVAMLRKELEPYLVSKTQAPARVDDETREKLASLGYVSTTNIVKTGGADPKDKIGIWSAYQEALEMKNAGEHRKALGIMEEVGRKESSNPFFQLQLAAEYRRAGKAAQAAPLLKKVIQMDARQNDAFHELALCYLSMKNYAEASRAIKSAIAIEPDRSEYHDTAGILFAEMGKLPDSISAFRKGLALDPNHPSLLNNYGNVLRSTGQLDEAATSYQRALDLAPKYASAWNGLGTVLFQKGKLQQATGALLRAKELDPSLHEVYYNLGIAYQAAGNIEQARDYYTTFLKLAPESMRDQRNAARQRLSELR